MSREVMKFLLGEGPLDGVWFGEKHPTEKGSFWWRKYLRDELTKPEVVAVPKRWRPIETAPKGFHLVSGHGGKQFIAFFNGKRWLRQSLMKPIVGLTHWMPLPTPPVDDDRISALCDLSYANGVEAGWNCETTEQREEIVSRYRRPALKLLRETR